MKVRVIKEGDKYYPESKGVFFWKRFHKNIDSPLVGVYFIEIYFTTQQEAIDYLTIYYSGKKVIKIKKEIVYQMEL